MKQQQQQQPQRQQQQQQQEEGSAMSLSSPASSSPEQGLRLLLCIANESDGLDMYVPLSTLGIPWPSEDQHFMLLLVSV